MKIKSISKLIHTFHYNYLNLILKLKINKNEEN